MNRKIKIVVLAVLLLLIAGFIIRRQQFDIIQPVDQPPHIIFNDSDDVIHLSVADQLFDPSSLIEQCSGTLTIEPEVIDCSYQQILKVRFTVSSEAGEKVYYKIIEISPVNSSAETANQADSPDEKDSDPQPDSKPVEDQPGCQLIWVVDVPYKPAVTQQIWVIDQPEIEEQGYWQDEYEVVKYWWIRTENGEYLEFSNKEDYQKKREEFACAGIAINGGTDYRQVKTGTVWIVVQAYQSEQGHYEEVVIEPEIKEQGHYEKKC